MHTAFSGNGGVKCYAVMFDLDKLYNDSTMTNKYLIPLKEQLLVLEDYITDDEISSEIDRIIGFYNARSMCVLGGVYNLLGLFFDKGYYKSNIKIPTNEKFYEIVKKYDAIELKSGVVEGVYYDKSFSLCGYTSRFAILAFFPP